MSEGASNGKRIEFVTLIGYMCIYAIKNDLGNTKFVPKKGNFAYIFSRREYQV
jgi:hypothetical protein